MHHFPEAESSIRQLLKLDENNLYALNQLAWVLGVQGRSKEALAELNQVLKTDPKDPDALEGVYSLYLNQGSPEKAEEILGDFADADPENAEARSLLAQSLCNRGEFEKCRDQAESAIKDNPNHPAGYRAYMMNIQTQDEPSRMLEPSKKWAELETDPRYTKAAQLNLLQVLHANNKEREARELAARLKSEDPEWGPVVDEFIQIDSK
jgi:tetratricopeptide (TPR) repeat protein